MADRVSLGEVVSARRSLTVGRLPSDVEERLLDELERLLREREQIAAVLGHLRAPFGDVRAQLRALHELVAGD